MGNEALARASLSVHFGSALTAATHGARGRHALYALRSMALVRAEKPALALKVRDDARCAESITNSASFLQDACSAVAFADGCDMELVLAARAAAAEALGIAEPVRAAPPLHCTR